MVAPISAVSDLLSWHSLAATTFPAEIVEADRWVQANPTLKGDDLAQAVDKQSWDPSVKALTAFPSCWRYGRISHLDSGRYYNSSSSGRGRPYK